MRKIPNNIENPLDTILINMADDVSPVFKKYKFTPNEITTISILMQIFSSYLLLNDYYYFSALFHLVAYFFDCLDGHYARKYNMETKFGDYYDHISDTFKFAILFYSLYYVNSEKFFKVIPIIIFFLVLSLIHLGCQEKYFVESNSESLTMLKNICPTKQENTKKELKLTRFFGCGTLQMACALAIIYYKY